MKPTPARRLPARFAACLSAILVLAGCAAAEPAGTSAAGPPAPPRLVVLLVADGLPQRQVTGYRDQLSPDGLNRFLERGAWFSEAHYGQAATVTAPGHAVLLTGAYPHRTGIVDNEWRDPATGEREYCTADASHGWIGHRSTRMSGTSPKNLLAESLGDVLRRADARSKVVAISGKDRGAILPAGRSGTAYMFMNQSGQFASTTYYMASHPAWVEAFNAVKPADRYFKATWSPLLPEMAYARSVPDGQPWFAAGGKLPLVLGEVHDAPGPAFYAQVERSPFLDALTLDFARAAIEGESLGRDGSPDLLIVSLSSHDYVNHAWGAESRLSHDHVLQLDNLLAAFFRDLDRRLGKDAFVAVLTSDHGFMAAPEYLQSTGHEGGRLPPGQLRATLNAALSGRFGEGQWAKAWSAQGIMLDQALAAKRGVDMRSLESAARKALRAEPGIADVLTRAEIEGREPSASPWLPMVRKAWHPQRSADLQIVLKPGWMWSSGRTGTTHGSPHPYDTHVPLAFYGPRWVKPGRRDARAEVADIAPTLAAMLRVAVPAASEGKPLPLAP